MKETKIYFPSAGIDNLHGLTKEQYLKYFHLIQEAKTALAYPDQSGYFVKTAGIAVDGTVWSGGNKEHGLSDAFVHGETAAISGLRDQTDSPIEAIAWYKEGAISPDDFICPCGNCRDVLKKYISPETVLINGNENAFVLMKFSDYLFEDFRYLNPDHVNIDEVSLAIDALHGGTDIYLPEEMRSKMYGAVLVGKDNSHWPGKHYSNMGYDAVSPLLSAIVSWQNSYPLEQISEKHLNLSKVTIVSETGIPDVLYRDRQALLELDEILRKYKKREPLRINLVYAKRDNHGNFAIFDARRTNTEEWLPRPFSSRAFGNESVRDAQLQKLLGK